VGSSVILPQPGQPATGPDADFRSAAIPNIVSFEFEKVAPPSQVYIQRDDVLVLQVASLIGGAGQQISITARLLLPYAQAPGQPDAPPPSGISGGAIIGPGYIQTIQQTLQIPTPRIDFSLVVPLTEGYLLSVAINCLTGTVRGTVFARAFINRGPFVPGTPAPVAMLVADYVTAPSPIGWPFGRFQAPSDGAGVINVETISNPGAGADFSGLVPTLTGRSRLQFFTAQFAAGAGVANRFPSFIVSCRGIAALSSPFQVQDSVAVTANQTVIYSVGPGLSFMRGGGAPAVVCLPLPGEIIGTFQTGVTEYTISSSTQGILAADQWSAISLCDEEWLDFF
jgi:hypothetical protein